MKLKIGFFQNTTTGFSANNSDESTAWTKRMYFMLGTHPKGRLLHIVNSFCSF